MLCVPQWPTCNVGWKETGPSICGMTAVLFELTRSKTKYQADQSLLSIGKPFDKTQPDTNFIHL